MNEETITPETTTETVIADAATGAVPESGAPAFGRGRRGARGRGGREGGRPQHRGQQRPERKSEFDQKTISVRRVARVMAGGRRFSFSVALVAGDKKGRVGVGLGKAGDTAAAIDKALRDAKKHMIRIPLTENKSISHDVSGRHAASSITIRPARGRGLVAGAAARIVLELGGVSDVTAKVLSRSRNKLNNARAAVDALKKLRS